MSNPLISVIVPVYKVEQYLHRCVNSIMNQTYKNLEIILVDDGSPDKCGEMCDELAKQDNRIRVIHKENGGLSSARNAGLDVMTGEYVGFVDSDDFIEATMYETLYSIINSQQADIVCCGIEQVADNGHIRYFNDNIEDFFSLNKEQALGELTRNRKITNSLCDKLYNKHIFDEIRMTEGIIYEDHDVMHKCIYHAKKIVYIGSPFYKYYDNDSSITGGDISPKHFRFLDVGKNRIRFYENYSVDNLPLAKVQYIETSLALIYKARKSNECKKLREALIEEIKTEISKNNNLPYTHNAKIKVIVFKTSVYLYYFLMNVISTLKRIVGKS